MSISKIEWIDWILPKNRKKLFVSIFIVNK